MNAWSSRRVIAQGAGKERKGRAVHFNILDAGFSHAIPVS
jgi:hypothetical protein